jgi:arylsulfatase A-like enzyme
LTRRTFLASSALATQTAGLVEAQRPTKRPNIVLIISDDQGYGDLSLHGNPYLATPNIDRIGKEGAQFTQFQVCPVCSPTRASLMTGRYNYRTGVVDTYLGRSMMHTDEVTMAQIFKDGGYRTGIFGKWHLGDTYPMRPLDRGFEEGIYIKGGGIGQPSDPPGGSSYTNPQVYENGKLTQKKGYCTDIFFRGAQEFVAAHREDAFFCYIAPNAPHDPLEVPDSYVAPFRGKKLGESTEKVYGMVANLDENVRNLINTLEKLYLLDDTILIFMTDNGPQHDRYNAGMRGKKTTVYQGGIRVPFLLRFPRTVKAGWEVHYTAAHIDVLPTLAELCRIRIPENLKLDGRSLAPVLTGQPKQWADRTIFTQWHRGDEPVLFQNSAARTQRYKLVNGAELYDMEQDPGEQTNIAQAKPEIVARLRAEQQKWFEDVSGTRGYAPPRIFIGTEVDNPVYLTRQDWRGPEAGWERTSRGHWEVDVRAKGNYEILLHINPAREAGEATVHFGLHDWKQKFSKGDEEVRIGSVAFAQAKGRLEAYISYAGSSSKLGVLSAEVRRIG